MRKTEEAIKIYQALVTGEARDDQGLRFQLAMAIGEPGEFRHGGASPDVAVGPLPRGEWASSPRSGRMPRPTRYIEWEARVGSNIGLILTEEAQKADATIAIQREAVAAAEQISDEFLRLDALATCRDQPGRGPGIGGTTADAEAVLRQALQDYRTLTGRFPGDIDYRWGLAIVLTDLAAVVGSSKITPRRHGNPSRKRRSSTRTFPGCSVRCRFPTKIVRSTHACRNLSGSSPTPEGRETNNAAHARIPCGGPVNSQ